MKIVWQVKCEGTLLENVNVFTIPTELNRVQLGPIGIFACDPVVCWACTCRTVWAPVCVLATSFLIQLPTHIPGKAAEIGSNAWAPEPTWEMQKKLLTLDRSCSNYFDRLELGRWMEDFRLCLSFPLSREDRETLKKIWSWVAFNISIHRLFRVPRSQGLGDHRAGRKHGNPDPAGLTSNY